MTGHVVLAPDAAPAGASGPLFVTWLTTDEKHALETGNLRQGSFATWSPRGVVVGTLDGKRDVGFTVRSTRGRIVLAMARYPGIVFVSDAFHGKARLLIPTLLHGAHGITGGAQDGLNLAIMETAYVNRDMDTSIICGSGAGFAIQAKASGLAEHAFFPRAGDVDAFVQAIQDAVCLQACQAWILRDHKASLVRYIMQRNDSVIVDD